MSVLPNRFQNTDERKIKLDDVRTSYPVVNQSGGSPANNNAHERTGQRIDMSATNDNPSLPKRHVATHWSR